MDKNSLKWFGQAFFKIYTKGGKVILIDPWKDFAPGNKLFPQDETVDDANVILITHGHLDHFGDSVEIATKIQAEKEIKVFSNFEISLYLMEKGIKPEMLQSMNKGGTVALGDLSFSLVDARHSSGIGPFGPKALIEGGEAGGFVVKLEDGLTIYHAGDTDVFSDMEIIENRFHPQVVLLPIGGVYTMDPVSAVMAVKLLKPNLVIPMHYGGTFGLPGNPHEFAENIKKEFSDSVSVLIPKPGEVVELENYTSPK